MNISLVGFGQMGQLIKQIAIARGHTILSIIDPFNSQATHREFCHEAMDKVDVCICFTRPDAALENIKHSCRWKKQLVMGTTGWDNQLTSVRQMVEEAGIGMLYSANFSIGVNIFFRLLEESAKVINQFEMYDIMAHETHHRKKLDSPSGTAKKIAQILLNNISRKTKVYEEKLDRKPELEELHFSSLRGGAVPGTHSVFFDSEFDTLELTHTARNRGGFATGAVIAAEWIFNQKGLFTEQDMMEQLLA